MTKLYQKLLRSSISSDEIRRDVEEASVLPSASEKEGILKTILSCIDLTSLNTTDNARKIEEFTGKVNRFNTVFPDLPNVAAVCVYPNFIQPALNGLKDCGVKLAVVSAAFPSSQTFLEVKLSETEIAVRNGADEIDIVLPVGVFLDKDYEAVIEEIRAVRHISEKTILKVILETGLLNDPERIYRASVIAIEAGADFIKTSTGKIAVSATPEAACIMCRAILDYYNLTGIMIGFKPAGGISSTKDAIVYYNIVKSILGDKWLTPEYFRIGASRLANAIIKDIHPGEADYF